MPSSCVGFEEVFSADKAQVIVDINALFSYTQTNA
jgi:hypothetical protein